MKTKAIEAMIEEGWTLAPDNVQYDLKDYDYRLFVKAKSKPNAIVDWDIYKSALNHILRQKLGTALDLLDQAVKKVE